MEAHLRGPEMLRGHQIARYYSCLNEYMEGLRIKAQMIDDKSDYLKQKCYTRMYLACFCEGYVETTLDTPTPHLTQPRVILTNRESSRKL